MTIGLRAGDARKSHQGGAMFGYILRRLVSTIPVMLIVAAFVLLGAADRQRSAAIIAGDKRRADQVAMIRQQLGLDKPIVTQLWLWISAMLSGDFGDCFFKEGRRPDRRPDRTDAGARRLHDHRRRPSSPCRSA